MKTIRLSFCKVFESRYISHLDLLRCFTRAVKRSGLKVWYTEGFNTHLYLTFPLPLSLGFESICECVELRLLDDEELSFAAERINPYLPKGIEIFNCAEAKLKPAAIACARYLIELADNTLSSAQILSAVEKTNAQDTIKVLKKTKSKKNEETDIKPLIKSLSAKMSGDNCVIDFVCAAGGSVNLNPNLFLGAVFETLGRETEHQLVKRTQILTENMDNFE